MLDQIADIRKDYMLRSLTESESEKDAIAQFRKWWHEALESRIEEINAMTLATASVDGLPSARIVLLKGFDDHGFRFFTNYNSFKGKQLEENPRACLVIFWRELERQIRITGLTSRIPPSESDAYFNSRPEGSRASAIISPQSQVISSREWLEQQLEKFRAENNAIVRPDHWGGYLLRPITIEFWQGRSNRLHDRLQYVLNSDGNWKIDRLAP